MPALARPAASIRRAFRAFGALVVLSVLAGGVGSAADAQVKQQGKKGKPPETPLAAAREENAVKDRPPSRHELPAGELRLSASELLATTRQKLTFTVTLDRAVRDGSLALSLPDSWLRRSGVSGLEYARVPAAGRGSGGRADRSGRVVTFDFGSGASGDSAEFSLTDNGIPPGTYELPYRWREAGRGGGSGVATVIFYAPVRESSEEPAPSFPRLANPGFEVNATNDDTTESETFLTVVPGDKRRFVVGANGGGGYNAWVTTDGGNTFVKRSMPTATDAPGEPGPESSNLCCDPMSAADAAGNMWYGGLSLANGAANPSRIVVNRIAAGTTTFQPETVGLPARTAGTQDKPMMTIDNSPTSPAFGRLYVVWDEPAGGGVNIVISQCNTRVAGSLDAARCDNADNWSVPVSVTPATSGYIYADVATGPDGKVYVVWWDYTATNAIRGDVCDPASQDCANVASWGTPQTIATLDATGGAPIPFACPIVAQPGGRASTSPQVDVDRSGGANNNRVYVTWSDLRTGSGTTRCDDGLTPAATHLSFDSFVASAAGALPGSANPSPTVATRLLTDGESGGQASSDDWFAWLAVDQTTGQAWADFYSTRHDATRRQTHFYVRTVTPAGGAHTLGALNQVSGQPSDYSTNPCCGFGNDYGDYTGIDATQGIAYPVWSDKRGGLDGEAFTFVEAAPSLVAETPTVNDSAGGDGDGRLEPGESFRLTQPLRNAGAAAANSVTSTLTESEPNLALTQTSSAYPNIAAGATHPNSTLFAGSLSATAPCGTPLSLTLQANTTQGPFTVPVSIPTGVTGAPATSTNSTPVAIPDGTPAGVTSTIALSGGGVVTDLNVGINITHTWVEDLTVTLTSPSGTTVTLVQRRGGSGDNFTNTVFDDEAATAISTGTPPFTGSFQPEAALSAFDGQSLAGTWTLKVVDSIGQDVGTLNSWSLTRPTVTCSPPPPPTAAGLASWSAPAPVKGDFDGDGFADLAIGAPGENNGAGVVHVIRGSAAGLTATGSQYWSQDSAGVAGSTEAGDGFGSSVAAGDVNGDGRADLAIGVPGEDFGAGAVHVLLGSASGVVSTGSRLLSQDTSGILDAEEPNDHLGATLAIGNYGGSSHGDLAIGAPHEDVGAAADAGVVHVLPGSASGTTATGSQYWDQNSSGILDLNETGDQFGASLAAGDVGSTTLADLAIGAAGENAGAGAVHVLLGTASGLASTGNQRWTQASGGIADDPEAGDGFGASLAIANLGGSTHGELAIGVPNEDAGAAVDAGVVHVLPGSASGPTGTGAQFWNQDVTGILDVREAGDRFGASLAGGDVGSTTVSDLAIGAPGENAGAGVVHTLLGTASGLTATGDAVWSQDATAVTDSAEPGDAFGTSVAIANFGGSIHGDLAIGAPGEDNGAVVDVGVAHVLLGSASGTTGTGSQYWRQDSSGISSDGEAGDRFGGGLGR